MEMPSVTTDVTDTRNKILWRIRAYRTVTESEARMAIATYLSQNKMPKPNRMVEIITVIGSQG